MEATVIGLLFLRKLPKAASFVYLLLKTSTPDFNFSGEQHSIRQQHDNMVDDNAHEVNGNENGGCN
ncbi:hypothetical protein FZC79_05770 [Rossellomorea vietnamensis]|uniref:Uncharacterized protein n=2 Tax=Rossellomorea TaxID=2837508 RepID=A0A5D4KGM3_9BACI|nr:MULTISPECIES: hypothetical protein [Rossellomorea]TYR76392.1 hypothetical protein FZC79_05770 [Rossellomorea vietnamensis]TYS76328.1 hypothetical protein FZC80_15475 [Rossellomorea aquimaris]